jgi:hypothetical protein
MQIPVSIRASYNMADIKALVDSGATDNFIHPNFVKRMGLGQRELDKPKNIYNIDDTANKSGQITHYLSLAVTTAGKTQEMRFLITDIGREDVLLRYPWLSTYEPRFSWKHGTIDESNLPVILRTINPSERRDIVVRYLSTDKRADIVAELECDVRGEPPIIQNASRRTGSCRPTIYQEGGNTPRIPEVRQCSVCHTRFPDEGGDVWRPDLRRREIRSLGGTLER